MKLNSTDIHPKLFLKTYTIYKLDLYGKISYRLVLRLSDLLYQTPIIAALNSNKQDLIYDVYRNT